MPARYLLKSGGFWCKPFAHPGQSRKFAHNLYAMKEFHQTMSMHMLSSPERRLSCYAKFNLSVVPSITYLHIITFKAGNDEYGQY